MFKFTHEKDVEEIQQLETDIKGQTAQTIKKIAAEKYQSVRVINAENERALAEMRATAKAKQILADAEAYENKMKQEADHEAALIIETAQAQLEVAQNRSQAYKIESGAEANFANNLQGKRVHVEKMQLMDSLKDTKAQFVVSGKNGQQLLDFYSKTLTEIEQR